MLTLDLEPRSRRRLQRLAGRMASLLREEGALFRSLTKWTMLASGVGVLVGGSTAVFLWTLDWAVRGVGRLPGGVWLLPLGLLVATLLVRWLAPQAEGHGTERVIQAVHRDHGRIPAAVAPVKLVATVLTIAVGGSVGKEGPCAQIGATLASVVSSLLRVTRHDRRRMVICGISAGFATVFGTPIAGSVFGLEVLTLGAITYDVLYPSFVAGLVGHQVAVRLGIRYFHEVVRDVPAPSEGLLLKIILAGVLFGLVALMLIEALRLVHRLAHRLPGSAAVKAVAGGLLLATLASLVSPRYLGLGLETVEASIRGAWVPPLAFLWKILFTAVSLGVGGSGGVVTPIFFVGASAGSTLGYLLGFDRGTFAAIGMTAVLAGAANTPLAASIMAIELFGPSVGPLAAIASIVSFVMVGHRSVYPSQLLAVAKTAAVRVRPGRELAGGGQVKVRTLRFRRLRVLQRALLRRAPESRE